MIQWFNYCCQLLVHQLQSELFFFTGIETVNWETFIKQLHPKRDRVRLTYIHDEEYERQKKEHDEKNECKSPDEQYEPEVFHLTET